MGNSLLVFTRPNIVNGLDDRIVLNADDKTGDNGILLEDTQDSETMEHIY